MTATSSPPIVLADTMQRRLDAASVEGALGVRVVAAGDGRVQLELPLPPLGSAGEHAAALVLESALAVLCDCGLGLAFMERRGAGDGGITLDLRVDAVEQIQPRATHLVLVAQALHAGEEHGSGRAEVYDDHGRLVAHATGTMAISPSLPTLERGSGAPARPHLDLATLFDGLEVRESVARVPIGPETENTRGIVHGALLGAAGLAVSRAAGRRGPLLSFAVEFLRPVPADVGELRATILPVRRGRRFVSDRVDLLLPDGRTAASVAMAFIRDGSQVC